MKSLLFDKPCIAAVWIAFLCKFRHTFNQLTGYDLMFESSRRDIKPTGPKIAHVMNEPDSLIEFKRRTLGLARMVMDKVQLNNSIRGHQRVRTLAPGRHSPTI